MARPVRIEYEGSVYHVTIRGNNRNAIFAEDSDRERFLADLEESVQRFDVRLYLFCLMTNHVHLVLETPRANLSSFMHRLQTAYTVYFSHRHHQSGHLMQGRSQMALARWHLTQGKRGLALDLAVGSRGRWHTEVCSLRSSGYNIHP